MVLFLYYLHYISMSLLTTICIHNTIEMQIYIPDIYKFHLFKENAFLRYDPTLTASFLLLLVHSMSSINFIIFGLSL